jgi:hypothetical protein
MVTLFFFHFSPPSLIALNIELKYIKNLLYLLITVLNVPFSFSFFT